MIPLNKFPRLALAEEIPPMTDLVMFFNRLPDNASKELFLSAHAWTLKMIVGSWHLPGGAEYIDLMETLSNHLGFDALIVWTAITARTYYKHVFGRQIINIRNVYELTRTTQSLTFGVDSLQKMMLSEDERLRAEFSGYRRFSLVFDDFWLAVARSIKSGDQIVITLNRQLKELECKSSKYGWDVLKDDTSQSFRMAECPFCHKYFRFELGRGIKVAKPHCGVERCRKDYDRLKPSKTSRKSTPSGWIKAHSRRPCQGSCGRERVDLNSAFFCKRCFPETFI